VPDVERRHAEDPFEPCLRAMDFSDVARCQVVRAAAGDPHHAHVGEDVSLTANVEVR
jgi:hypothetical protein